MPNTTTATLDHTTRRLPAPLEPEPDPASRRFAPLFTAGTEPSGLAACDELGRPLAGAYVPDGYLL